MAKRGERGGVVVGLACHVATNVKQMSVVGQKTEFCLMKSLLSCKTHGQVIPH